MQDTILVVDDDSSAIKLMARILEGLGTLRFATNGADAVRLALEVAPDLVLLDAQMPGMSGFMVFDALKELPELADVPVIFVTSHCESEFEIGALDMGATDFIAKPVQPPLVQARVRTQLRVKHLADTLRRSNGTDGLTGVANRRHFDESLEREWLRGQRRGDPLALLFIDIDHFKSYNDCYGHRQGDACLKQVVRAVQRCVRRSSDLVARSGGEEFAALLPATSRAGGEFVSQQILDAVASLRIRHEGSLTSPHVSVSIGIGCYDEASATGKTPDAARRHRDEQSSRFTSNELILAADRALRCAKRSGRAQAQLLDIADSAALQPALTGRPRVRSAERV
jgi:diguanylate cyclase (GGDEF)-like protein